MTRKGLALRFFSLMPAHILLAVEAFWQVMDKKGGLCLAVKRGRQALNHKK